MTTIMRATRLVKFATLLRGLSQGVQWQPELAKPLRIIAVLEFHIRKNDSIATQSAFQAESLS